MSDLSAITDLPVAWEPTPEALERSRLLRFMRAQGFGHLPRVTETLLFPKTGPRCVSDVCALHVVNPWEQAQDADTSRPAA